MSVTFYGIAADREPIALDFQDPAHLNLAGANARAFLSFLGIEPGDEPSGEATLPDARRAIMRARATFDRKVGCFTRDASDTRRPRRCRVIEGALDPDYFAMRLNDFERFLDAMVERGARSIYWA